jgi:hypothetical protein
LPALILMPATDPRMMLVVDLPLCFGATGSLATFYIVAEKSQGRTVWDAVRRLPMLIALGAGLAPHLSRAVYEGLKSMSGEFVRTPKKGIIAGRYRQHAELPWLEIGLALLSAASVVASLETGHWFAAPFASLFMLGYSYVAWLVVAEQVSVRRAALARASEPPAEAVEQPAMQRAA